MPNKMSTSCSITLEPLILLHFVRCWLPYNTLLSPSGRAVMWMMPWSYTRSKPGFRLIRKLRLILSMTNLLHRVLKVWKKIDELADSTKSGTERSEVTKAYKALEFLADNAKFVPGRKTSIITIQDGYSNPINGIDSTDRIKTQMERLKAKQNLTFYSAGIRGHRPPHQALSQVFARVNESNFPVYL